MKGIKTSLNLFRGCALLIFLALGTYVHAQTNVTLELPVTTVPSITVNPGTSVTFNAGTGCATDYLVQNMSVPMDQTTYNSSPFVHAFTDVGTFSIQCDCPTGLGSVCTSAYNVSVVSASEPIPTLGEWGLIIAFILLTAIGLVALRSGIANKTSKAS